MKKNIFKASLLLGFAGILAVGCGKSELPGYKKTDNGLFYKFETENAKNQKVENGDLLVGELVVKLDTTTLMSNAGQAGRLFIVGDAHLFPFINEGLLMLHLGDKASFAVDADTVNKYAPFPANTSYKAGSGSKVYFDISLESIINKDELAKEKAVAEQKMETAKASEQDSIHAYLTKNNIKQQPTASGIYIISVKKGNGAKAELGKTVKLNYTGRFLDGRPFDTSIEKIAKEGNIYNPKRPYEPLEYVCGEMPLIKGWDEAIYTMKAGDIVNVVIPSAMAYGAQGAPGAIPPYTPLVFTMELISVK